jgi:hypothetical protein
VAHAILLGRLEVGSSSSEETPQRRLDPCGSELREKELNKSIA